MLCDSFDLVLFCLHLDILQKEKKVVMDMKKKNNSLTLGAHLMVLHHFI